MKARGACENSPEHLREYLEHMSIEAKIQFANALDQAIREGGSIVLDAKTGTVRYHPPQKVGRA